MESLAVDEGVRLRDVLEQVARTVFEARMPNHTQSMSFCEEIGLISLDDDIVRLTEQGRTFLLLNPGRTYELTDDQKKLLLEAHFLGGTFGKRTRTVLEAFAAVYGRETYRWNRVDSTPIGDNEELLAALVHVGLVIRKGNTYEIARHHVSTVATWLDSPKGLTPEEFEVMLAERKELGRITEDLAITWERNRLRRAGHPVEAECVQLVSRIRDNAGYDLESYDGARHGVRSFDRYIEVKGTKGEELRFFWSENEQRVAKKLGPKYWIYFIGGVDPSNRTARREPLMFQDPASTLNEDKRFKIGSQGVIVQGKLKGAPGRLSL